MKAAISPPTPTPTPLLHLQQKGSVGNKGEGQGLFFFLKGENVICQSGSDVSTIKLISLEKEEKGKEKVVSAAERRRKKGQREPMLGERPVIFQPPHSQRLSGPSNGRPVLEEVVHRRAGEPESRRAGEPGSGRIRTSGVPKVSEGSGEQRGAAGAAGCRGLQKRGGEEESARPCLK